ncbi:snoRNA-binding rRNA-processing protein NOP14 [Fusarium oxysporum Fo47]|uniref:snoRNA-binding rRNA-processing protein NOP14 n=1 Tax=Fusarium oxysporum Fo47 TaxID=660027 RepID=UPI002869D144|nr:snoRNA-binding rRNA-processing protein NOP14 [Fusarium oxysporum Fo47]WJG34981.1 Nop14-like family-domain-containing protein [Fusarium oxysporum Fo47]
MAGSQLKRLKASLKEQGIVGPQQSKKQKRRNAQDERSRNDKRLQRGVVLEGIREQFNPFDLKHAKGPKFEVTSNRPTLTAGSIKGRPGQAKAASEERRRQTLLVEMQRRNKVGGILDRRFGENDPTMAPEDKMLERFAREKQRSHKKNSMFDLEDDDASEGLTHMGKSLSFDDMDDFKEDDLEEDYDSDGSVREQQRLKRVRAIAAQGSDGEDDEPERKKTKKEVMEEVIAKSKHYKYERQAAKEEDEELREKLDKELQNIQYMLHHSRPGAKPQNEGAAKPTIAGVDRDAFEKNFDLQVKKLAQDKRAQPADRTKTEEEKAEEESTRLKELEDKRQKRMRGESVSDSEDEEVGNKGKKPELDAMDLDDEEDFGLGSGIRARPTATELGFDDEDDFVIDDDLVASGSDLALDSEDESDMEDGSDEEAEDEEDDFTKGLLNEEESRNPVFDADSTTKASAIQKGDEQGLPYTFECPQTCDELQVTLAPYPAKTFPTIVQRIRALYHPKLSSMNKEKLGNFATALVDYIGLPWDPATSAPFTVLESIVRHIHSLAKMFPIEISKQFRKNLEEMGESRPLALGTGDLVFLSAVGTIFPTSDHFHQVVTPAVLTITRYLGQRVPQNLAHYAIGTYLCILAVSYQKLAKRYVPEVINFSLNTLLALAPVATSKKVGNFPLHNALEGVRTEAAAESELRRLNFSDCIEQEAKKTETIARKIAILDTTAQVIEAAADTWTGKSAFLETFGQAASVLKHLGSKTCRSQLPTALNERLEKLQVKFDRMLKVAQLSRRNVELHHHRPLAIKTYVPKFEETFDPDKHYDPDRERAELAKLKKEHKKERKGALRELRKDANFMAREKLRIKKAKDEAYEKKYKRLVAEIQSEEGREANAYEREKSARKRAKNSLLFCPLNRFHYRRQILQYQNITTPQPRSYQLQSKPSTNTQTRSMSAEHKNGVGAQDEEEDDYMNMSFDDPTPVKETSIQRTQRLKRESRARGIIKSKEQIAEEGAAAREKALSTSMLDDAKAKKSKGLAMMAKMGFTGEPIKVSVKDDRGGIGLDNEKKRKVREAAEERDMKAVKMDPDEYRERPSARQRGWTMRRQKFMALALHYQILKMKRKIRHREEVERDRRMRYDLEQSLSRLPTYEDDQEDADDKRALGKGHTVYATAEDLDEEDKELDQFNELEIGERLKSVLEYLREKHQYCFWCKMAYPDAEMEGCPGLTEENHD